MYAHVVFVPKYRRNVFTKAILESMRLIFNKVCQNFDANLIEFEGEADQVHLLVSYHPEMASKLVNSLKGVSSRMLRQQHPEILKYYWKGVL